MHRLWIALGSLFGLAAVAMAAWAAHGAPAILSEGSLGMLDRALTMQGWHALALLAVGLWAERRGGWLPNLAGAAFALGALLFCSAVYSLAIRGISLGRAAPAGGMLLMAGWLLLALSAIWAPRRA